MERIGSGGGARSKRSSRGWNQRAVWVMGPEQLAVVVIFRTREEDTDILYDRCVCVSLKRNNNADSKMSENEFGCCSFSLNRERIRLCFFCDVSTAFGHLDGWLACAVRQEKDV